MYRWTEKIKLNLNLKNEISEMNGKVVVEQKLKIKCANDLKRCGWTEKDYGPWTNVTMK